MSSFKVRACTGGLALTALLSVAHTSEAQTDARAATPASTPVSTAASIKSALTEPATARTDDIRPIARPLMWTGATVFAATYLASAIGATTGYNDDVTTVSSRGFLWIPMAGPFMLIPTTRGAGWDALLALDGVAQVAGLATFTAGLALKHAHPAEPASSVVSVTVSPIVTRGTSGVALVGTF